MQYQQTGPLAQHSDLKVSSSEVATMLKFPPPSLDMSFDDSVFESVATVWSKIMGPDISNLEFLKFPDREGEADEDGDEDWQTVSGVFSFTILL